MEALDIHDGDDASAGAKVQLTQLDLLLARLGGAVASAPTTSGLLALTERGPDAAGLVAALGSDRAAGGFLIAFARRGHSPRPVAGVGDAVDVLGAEGVWAALLGRCVLDHLGPACEAAGLDGRALWLHGLAVGGAAEAVAHRLGRGVPPLLAFVCGLGHDLGKFALAACVPKSYRRVLDRASGVGGDIAEFERQVIGIDHSAAGRRVAQRWGLGTTVAEAVRLHHHPPEAMPSPGRVAALAQVVQLADVLARQRGLGFSGNAAFPRSGEALAEALGLPAGALHAVTEELDESFDRLRAAAEAHRDGYAPTGSPETGRTDIRVPPDTSGGATPAERILPLLRDVLAPTIPTTSLATLCAHLARAFSAAVNDDGDEVPPAWPTGAFVVAPDGTRAILAVHGGPETGAYRFTACRAPLPDAPAGAAPAGEVLAGLLTDGEAWSELIDIGGAACWPLVAGGDWVGGVCLPERLIRSPDRRQIAQALAELAGPVVGLALGQAGADDLADRLRQVSQRLAETRQALAQTEALAAVGEMAAGAAHEINNPLAVIAGRAQLLARQVRTKKAREAAELIAQKAQDVSDIVADLMEFAHPMAPTPSPVAAADLVAAAQRAASDDATASSAKVETHVAAGCPPVWADAEQMAEVLLEAVRNAVEAAGGAVGVRIDAAPDAGGAGVVFRVADDGPGMDAATLAHAFTPFFSQRTAGRRRGMGLSRARRRVQAHGGQMWIDSSPGRGTTVHVKLPQAASEGRGNE